MSFEKYEHSEPLFGATDFIDASVYATIKERWDQFYNKDTDIGFALTPLSPHIDSTAPPIAVITQKRNKTHIGLNMDIDIDLEHEIKRMFLGLTSSATNIRLKQSIADQSYSIEAYDMIGPVPLTDMEKLDFIEAIMNRCGWRAIRKNEPVN